MSLLLDIQNYIKRYGSATQPELVQQFQTTPEMVEMIGETLRAKGRVRFARVKPACAGGCCGGSCGEVQSTAGVPHKPVRVYEWVTPAAAS